MAEGFFAGISSVYIIVLILNTIGNVLVIQAILKTHRLRTASNFLVANLAFCDLLSPLLNIPIDLSVKLSSHAWHYGSIACRLIWPIATMMTTSSALTLVAISLDRSRALRHPFVTKLTTCQSVWIVLLIHCISLVVSLPYALASVIVNGQCLENWNGGIFSARQYTLIMFHVQYLLPLIILAYVYGRAAHYLRHCTRSLGQLEECTGSSVDQSETGSFKRRRSHPPKSPSKQRSLRIRREQNTRVMKMFAVVVTVFAFLTLPNNVQWLVHDFANNSSYPHRDVISSLCALFTYLNCFANPIIYGTFSKDYKVSFLRVLTLGCYGSGSVDSSSHAQFSRVPSSVRKKRSFNHLRGDNQQGDAMVTRV